MKRMIMMMVLLALALGAPQAGAEGPVFGPDFALQDTYLAGEDARESLLVKGVELPWEQAKAVVYGVDEQGGVLWRIAAEGAMEGESLFGVIPLDGAVGIWSRGEADWMNIVRDEAVVDRWALPEREIGPGGQYYTDVFGVKDGVLVFYRKEQTPHSPRTVALYDMEGKLMWEKEHQLNWYISEAVRVGDGYLAWGWYSEEVNAESLAYVVALDGQGEVVWQHKVDDSVPKGRMAMQSRSINFGFPQADGSLVIEFNQLDKDYNGLACFARIGAEGVVWAREMRFETDGKPSSARISSMIAVEDGYYAACEEARLNHAVRMLKLDREGNIQAEWLEATPEVGRVMDVQLVPAKDGLKLLYDGFEGTDAPVEGEARVTYWKDVEGA